MLRVLIIGIGNPVPSFINRRLMALSNAGVQLTVVVEHNQVFDLPKAYMVRIGGKKSLARQLLSLLSVSTMPHLFVRLLLIRPELAFLKRLRWAVKYFPLTRIHSPEVVHIQWLSSVHDFHWLSRYFKCPLVASARGSQLTVYPFARPGFETMIRGAIQKVDYIHCVSADMASACKQFGASQEKIFVNYNGIDLVRFCPLKSEQNQAEFTIISVGAMMWRKGFHYQLQLLNMLVREGRNVKLLLLGDGPDREGLIYTSHILKLGQYVTFTGKIKSSELPDWLNRADVYLSTSVAEGLANSVVEAIACGLPVVAFACEGMEEVLKEGVNGFILPFGDLDGVTKRIRYLMDHPQERKMMSISARKHAEEKFNENVWVSHMIKKYQTIGEK